VEKLRREQLEQEFKEVREQLESDMELAYQDYQTTLMREGARVCVCEPTTTLI
jgi:hypothetical protein